jgi:hypothetical protein
MCDRPPVNKPLGSENHAAAYDGAEIRLQGVTAAAMAFRQAALLPATEVTEWHA